MKKVIDFIKNLFKYIVKMLSSKDKLLHILAGIVMSLWIGGYFYKSDGIFAGIASALVISFIIAMFKITIIDRWFRKRKLDMDNVIATMCGALFGVITLIYLLIWCIASK